MRAPDGRSYVGMTCDLKRRLREHVRKPPPRMQAVLSGVERVQDVVEVIVLAEGCSKGRAQQLEEEWIDRLQTQGPNGYNKLRGTPAACRGYWFLKRRGII